MNSYYVVNSNNDEYEIQAEQMASYTSGAVTFQIGVATVATFYKPIAAYLVSAVTLQK